MKPGVNLLVISLQKKGVVNDDPDRIPVTVHHWAKDCDITVTALDGYERVLDEGVKPVDVQPRLRILDLSTSTGNLTERFIHEGCKILGIDFSANIRTNACTQVPQAPWYELYG